MNKKIFLIGIIVFALIILVFYSSFEKKKDKEGKLILVLDYGNNKRSFQVSGAEQKRAWSLLQQVASVSKINLEATPDFYPKKIDGLADGSDNKHWVFYVNGIKQDSSPFDTFVKAPSEVVFRFE
jgi:hypothetical protein